MQESYRKGIAIHPGLESCVCRREAVGEAYTEASVGRVSFEVTTNTMRFRHRLFWLWWKVVGRRSDRRMRWDRYCSIFDRWVPYPRILHPYPSVRFDAMHPR